MNYFKNLIKIFAINIWIYKKIINFATRTINNSHLFKKMKKVFALLFVAGMITVASCESKKAEETVDSTVVAVDSAVSTVVDSASAIVDSATAVIDSVAK